MKIVSFRICECGNSPEEAFWRAQGAAAIYGTSSGIENKHRFEIIHIPKNSKHNISKHADEILRDCFPKNKPVEHTPAICLDKGDNEYLFVGWTKE